MSFELAIIVQPSDARLEPPESYLFIQDGLIISCGVLYALCYMFYMTRTVRDKTCAGAVEYLCGTMAYEIYYAFTTTTTTFERLSFMIWFLLDASFATVAVFSAYHPSRRTVVACRLVGGVIAGLGFLHVLCQYSPDEREQVTAYWTGLLLQLPIGWGSLYLLLTKRNTKGHSLEIWVTRFLGCIAAYLTFFWRYWNVPENWSYAGSNLSIAVIAVTMIPEVVYPFVYIQVHLDQEQKQKVDSTKVSCRSTIMQSTTAPAQAMSGVNISKRRKFVADGVFYAELNEFFQRELAEEGYSGVEVRVTPTVTDIIIRATHTQEVLGEQGRRIRELTSLITHRFRFPPDSVSLYAAKVQSRGLSAVAQCESLRYKLLNGLAVRRACYGVLRFIMESGAKGCEVVVSGKLRAARAKSMKFTDGFMIHSGQPAKDFIDSATRHVLLRQGVLGIKVKIMRASSSPNDPSGEKAGGKGLPDSVTIIEPKEEQPILAPSSQDYGAKAAQAQTYTQQQQAEQEGAPAEDGAPQQGEY
ncbi:hypothetical protein BST61_g5113 [Cercospora zeina]